MYTAHVNGALHVPFNSTSYNLMWPEDNCAMVCSVVEESPKPNWTNTPSARKLFVKTKIEYGDKI